MRTGSRKDAGFVLVATLWFLAAIAVVAAFFAGQIGGAVESAFQSRRMTDAMVEMAGTRAEAFFHLATDGFREWGLGLDPRSAIALDDRPYRGIGSDVIRLQDDRGLLNLNFPDQFLFRQLLSDFGVPAEKHSALFDAVADFTDIDNLRRLNGAEAPEYRAVNLPPPPNDWMYSPHQLKSIYGWHQLSNLWNDGSFLPLLTTSRVLGFNPNTAPREILLAAGGRDNVQLIEEILRLRKSDLILASKKTSALLLSRAINSENIFNFPGDSIRVTQQSPSLPWALEINVTLTPMREFAPWHIDYYAKIRVKSKTSDEISISRFPSVGSISATAAGAP